MISVQITDLETVLELRDRYLAAVNAQIVHDSWHSRGRTTLYRIAGASGVLGYGAVGSSSGQPHDTVKEFYVVPEAEPESTSLFRAFLAAARPRWIEAQTNDPFLAPRLRVFAPDHAPHTYLFTDSQATSLPAPGVQLRPVTKADHGTVFAHTTEPVGTWGLDRDGTLAATGGLFFHYNPPYGDLYMEVAPEHRRKGYASYLLQELKRIGYETGHVPAARCQIENLGSRGALERAGMYVCGAIARGPIAI
ncbi:MAG: GNAT family N-acetyltransferase [Gemmatimonadota bacterium]